MSNPPLYYLWFDQLCCMYTIIFDTMHAYDCTVDDLYAALRHACSKITIIFAKEYYYRTGSLFVYACKEFKPII